MSRLTLIHTQQELPVETNLYREYRKHPRSLRFIDGDVMSEAGHNLLANFSQAITCYIQVPESREYCIQENVRKGEL